VNDTRLVTIVNDGPLDAAAEAFVRLLATLRYSPGVRRRA
jgi:ribose 1,5-bisphosphokinase